MKINKINTKSIKPQTPTPQNLKKYKISFLDNSLSPMNLAVVLFYQSKPQNLQQSLSETLVQFYPLAGRYIKTDHFVDCSDQGAELIETEALGVDLLDLVSDPDADELAALYPENYFRSDEAPSNPLLSIQISDFRCGGVAVAVSVSHRIFDVPAMETFISAWSSTCNPGKSVGFAPTFDLPKLLPLTDHDFGINLGGSGSGSGSGALVEMPKVLVKRLLFDKAALASLKSKISKGETLTGASIVSAVIGKVLVGIDYAKQGKYRDFVVFQLVNMRERTTPPQPKRACGNLCFTSLTPPHAAAEGKDLIDELVDLMSGAVEKSIADHIELLSPDRDGREIIKNSLQGLITAFRNPDTNFLVFSDCSEFEFYEADFGEGKPVWIFTRPQRPRGNTVALMSSKEGDGIEAWVYLNEKDMAYFEQDEEVEPFIL